MRKALVPLVLLLLAVRCDDHGLEPVPPVEPGFGGVIYYENWPPADSLKDLRLVAFQDFPPQNILQDVINGRAYVFPKIGESGLPFYVDSTEYEIHVPPARYAYVVVAQQFSEDLFSDWRAVGQFDIDADLTVPAAVRVSENTFIADVDIFVDFWNPPPTPIAP